MASRRYNLSLGELLDRLSICELKHAKIPEHKAEYAKEIEDIVHDINLILTETQAKEHLTAEYLRDVIILAQFNSHIWYNEEHSRDGTEGESNLRLTHSLNGVRSITKNRLSKPVGGRLDYKIDCLAADAEHWRPSGY